MSEKITIFVRQRDKDAVYVLCGEEKYETCLGDHGDLFKVYEGYHMVVPYDRNRDSLLLSISEPEYYNRFQFTLVTGNEHEFIMQHFAMLRLTTNVINSKFIRVVEEKWS